MQWVSWCSQLLPVARESCHAFNAMFMLDLDCAFQKLRYLSLTSGGKISIVIFSTATVLSEIHETCYKIECTQKCVSLSMKDTTNKKLCMLDELSRACHVTMKFIAPITVKQKSVDRIVGLLEKLCCCPCACSYCCTRRCSLLLPPTARNPNI